MTNGTVMFSNWCLLKAKQRHGHSVQQSCVLVTWARYGVAPLPSVIMTNHHHFIIIFKNVHGPTSLALFIASVSMIYISTGSFMCFQLSSCLRTNQHCWTLLSTAELTGSPSLCCSCWDARCWLPQTLFTSFVAGPCAFSMVESSSAPFHTPGNMWTLCSCIC